MGLCPLTNGCDYRFQREEAKIQAWENHEKAKAEAEMRRIEVSIQVLLLSLSCAPRQCFEAKM